MNNVMPSFPYGGWPPMQPMYDPRMFYHQALPTMLPPGPAVNSGTSLVESALKHAASMSSNDDVDRDPYPFVASFFSDLSAQHPSRPALEPLAHKFEMEDLLKIDEVAALTDQQLRVDFGLSIGNARFILERVGKEMKRIDRLNAKKKHHRH
jgi:hypothetical protein